MLAPHVHGLPAQEAAFFALRRDQALAAVQRWQGGLPVAATGGAASSKPDWAAAAIDDSAWPTLQAPQTWEEQGLPTFDGTLWYRKRVELSADRRPARRD